MSYFSRFFESDSAERDKRLKEAVYKSLHERPESADGIKIVYASPKMICRDEITEEPTKQV